MKTKLKKLQLTLISSKSIHEEMIVLTSSTYKAHLQFFFNLSILDTPYSPKNSLLQYGR